MNRRQFFFGLMGTAIAAGGVVGSGAFNSSEIDRNITLSVKGDENAYLELDDISPNFAKDGDGQLHFVFDEEVSEPGGIGESETGDGVNTQSTYEFSNIANVTNSGTKDIVIFGQYRDDKLESAKLTQSTPSRPEPLTSDNPSKIISPGESINFGLVLEVGDVDPQTLKTEIEIVGASEDSELYPEVFPDSQD